MVYAFLGDDRYTKKLEARKIAEQQDSLLISYDLNGKDQWEPFKQQITTPYLFGKEYLFFLSEFDSVSTHIQTNTFRLIGAETKKKSVSVILDFVGSRENAVIKAFPVFHYELPKPWKHNEWIGKISKRAKEFGISLQPEQSAYLYDCCGADPEKIDNELKKLAVIAENSLISSLVIQEIVYAYQPENLNDFIFAVIGKEYPTLIKKIRNVFAEYPENLILYQIIKMFLNLAYLQTSFKKKIDQFDELRSLSKETGLNIPILSRYYGFSFDRTEKNINYVTAYPSEEISDILSELWQIDYSQKNEGESVRNSLIRFINRRNTRAIG
jgi:DNA polymerase III delta subunit